MHILKISHDFFAKLETSDWKPILRLYGYSTAEQYMQAVIRLLNEEYDFLQIEAFDFLTETEQKTYKMYNGYIAGNFDAYDEITVSFSTVDYASRDIFVSQQLMPMVCKRLKADLDYLTNPRIKRIFCLTTHISAKLHSAANAVADENNTVQLMVKSLNTLGFDVLPVIPIRGVSTDARFYTLNDYLANLRYLARKNKSNDQREYISLTENTVTVCCKAAPKGQDAKHFIFRYLVALALNDGFTYDFNAAYDCLQGEQIDVFRRFASSLKEKNVSFSVYRGTPVYFVTDSSLRNDIRRPTKQTVSKGRLTYTTDPQVKAEKIEKTGYVCICNDGSHRYFTSEKTKRNYVEGHHIIPMSYQRMYEHDAHVNLDVVDNIAPLCPHCHKKVHHGTVTDKEEVLKILYTENEKALLHMNPTLTLFELATYYNVYDEDLKA